MNHLLPVGSLGPDFDLPQDDGSLVSFSGLRGRKVVVYFYPRADTPGCTKEAIDFNRLRGEFEAVETTVLGVSADPVQAQQRFKAKHGLRISLVSDETHEILERYGVWGEKSMYGKTFMGVSRVTYLIDREGRVARIWPNVSVEGHAAEVLDAARAL